jgi:hypothetical protein
MPWIFYKFGLACKMDICVYKDFAIELRSERNTQFNIDIHHPSETEMVDN